MLLAVLVDIASLQMGAKNILGYIPVVLGVRMGEQVERQTELEIAVNKCGMKPIDDFSRADPLGLGPDGNRGAVRVGATHHQHMVAAHPLEAGKDIRGKIGAGNMADVLFAVCVRPGDANKYMPWVIHVCLLESSFPSRQVPPQQVPAAYLRR